MNTQMKIGKFDDELYQVFVAMKSQFDVVSETDCELFVRNIDSMFLSIRSGGSQTSYL